MKTEQLIVRYLYNNKKVSLQDIGTFTLSPEVNIPTESDKDAALPPDAIRFIFDPKEQPDEGLVNYIIEHTRKIRPLATSDLESYSMLNKQFLNIGKPLILEGIGMLQKTQTGEYAFTQSTMSHVIYEEAPKLVTEKQKEKVTFATPPRERSNNGGKAALVLVILLLLAGAAFAAYYYFYLHEPSQSAENNYSIVTPDSSGVSPINSDTVPAAAARPQISDTNSFYVVIKEFTTADAADKSLKRLTAYGHQLVISGKDSSFKLRMPFVRSLADTIVVKDSLSKFFSARTYVELP